MSSSTAGATAATAEHSETMSESGQVAEEREQPVQNEQSPKMALPTKDLFRQQRNRKPKNYRMMVLQKEKEKLREASLLNMKNMYLLTP